MNEFNIAEYGVAAGAIASLIILVRYFLAHLEKKDKTFTNVIENHIDHNTKVQERLCSAVNGLCEKLK